MDTTQDIPFYPKDEVLKFKLPRLREVCNILGIDHENATGNGGAANLRKKLVSYYKDKFPEKFVNSIKKPRVPLIPDSPPKEMPPSPKPKPKIEGKTGAVDVKPKPKPKPKIEGETGAVDVKPKPKPKPKIEGKTVEIDAASEKEIEQKFFIKEDDVEIFEFNGQSYAVSFEKELVYGKDVEGDWIVAGKWNVETEMPELYD